MSNRRDYHNEEFKILVTFGESVTAGGCSSNRERCWASRLAALINDVQSQLVKLVNSGIGANVISTRSPAYENSGKPSASERLDKHVIAHNPDLLVISYGLNDARSGTPLELFAEEMKGIIECIREKCRPLIVLLGSYSCCQ
jgi:lysophospholipase L1-like esterase